MHYDRELWNERYKANETVYGPQPNQFLREQLGKLQLPAEGEGRNALIAAANGWDVIAFDLVQKQKTKLAEYYTKFKLITEYKT